MLLRLRRPLRIVTGYVGACLVAGALMAMLIVAQLPDKTASEIVPGFLGATTAMARISGIVGLLPSIAMIGLLEWRAERRWLVYAAFGAILAAVAGLVISGVLADPKATNILFVIVGSALLGVASATAYWWIAGRLAGRIAIIEPA